MKRRKKLEKSQRSSTQLKATTAIVRVIESYGVKLKAADLDYIGLCPFHEDSGLSLRVTPSKGLFQCPVCNATGNVVQFITRMRNISEREAALQLCQSVPGVISGSDLLAAGEKKDTSL
jgi:DNA primase